MKTLTTDLHELRNQWWFAVRALLCLVLMITIGCVSATAQVGNYFNTGAPHTDIITDTSIAAPVDQHISNQNNDEMAYDEISVMLSVQRIGSVEIAVIIYGQQVYLPVKDIFEFLKIKIASSHNTDTISGFFIHPSSPYVINYPENKISYGGIDHDGGKQAMIRTETNLYMRIDLFGQIFGLECTFNFRSLSATLVSTVELPAIREMRQEILRKNISGLNGEKKADTTLARGGSFFRAGVADWNIAHIRESEIRSNTRVSLGLGAMIAGGEANLHLNYNSIGKGNFRQQYYSWRHVNNNNSLLRQLVVGKIIAPSVSSLFSPVKGIQITNTPTTYRRSYGTYRLTNQTEPGWTVELYVNNVLVNYLKADASGFFSFDVPLVYGNSMVQLKFYGPWGEERIREQNISIPFNFLPVNEIEYSITAGIVDDSTNNKFSRAVINYGLGKRITVGAGAEYFTSANTGKPMPFVNASMRIASAILLSAEHVKDVRTKVILNHRLPSNLQLDMNYTRYEKGQTAVRYNYLEEKKVSLTKPFRGKKFSAFGKLAFNQYTTETDKINAPEFVLSSVIRGVSSNLTTSAFLRKSASPIVYTNLAVTLRVMRTFRLTPQLQYEYGNRNFSMLKLDAEKTLHSNGFINVSYERNIITHDQNVTVGLRYNFNFAQTFFSARKSNAARIKNDNGTISTTLSARGSLIHEKQSGKLIGSSQINMGKGGLVFAPFLDLNHNGRRDQNEPAIEALKLRINSGRLVVDKKDSTIRVTGLEAYTNYFVEFDKNSLQNMTWKLKHATMRIAIDPNHIKVIEVPVLVMGEAAGYVYIKKGNDQEGISRVIVNIYNKAGILVAKTLTEQDGYFSYLGLSPGEYTVFPDENQLKKLKMKSTVNKTFTIHANREGDIVDNLEFILNIDR